MSEYTPEELQHMAIEFLAQKDRVNSHRSLLIFGMCQMTGLPQHEVERRLEAMATLLAEGGADVQVA